MYQIIDGKALAKKIRENLKKENDKLKEKGIVSKLAVILVGDDSAAKIYVRNKSKACQDVGVEYEEILLSSDTTMKKLLDVIDELNNRKDINGILLQSPIPRGLDIKQAFERIDYRKDVDGFNPWTRLLYILYTLWNNKNARRIQYTNRRKTGSSNR